MDTLDALVDLEMENIRQRKIATYKRVRKTKMTPKHEGKRRNNKRPQERTKTPRITRMHRMRKTMQK